MVDVVCNREIAADLFNNPGIADSTYAGAMAWEYGNGIITDDPQKGRILEVKHYKDVYGVSKSDEAGAEDYSGVQNDFYWNGGDKSSIYLAIDMKFPDNWIWPPGIHMAQIQGPTLSDGEYPRCRFQVSSREKYNVPDGSIGFYFSDQNFPTSNYNRTFFFNPLDANNPPLGDNSPDANYQTITLGVWHSYEMYLEMNTPGVADGKMMGWFDGKLMLNKTDMKWQASGDNVQWTKGQFTTWHGGNTQPWASKANQSIFFDNIIVSDSRITG
jgi:hypothetical protein